MKVVMFTNAVAPDKLGGLERYVRELGARLVRSGVGVTVPTKRLDRSHAARELGADGVLIHRHAIPPRTNPLFAPRYLVHSALSAQREGTGSRGAVLHTHYVLPALGLALRGYPYLHTFHAPLYRELLSERLGSYPLPGPLQRPAVAGLRAAERTVVRRSVSLVVLSEFMRRELSRLDAEAARRAHLVPGGVDLARFAPGRPTSDPWASSGAPLLFSARRFTPRTGVRELLRAMPAIRSSLPGARLALAGAGRMEPDLRREAADLDLNGSVRFLGRISDDELTGWYRAADLVVLPTQELEGFGLTTAEALACGTPVLARPSGALPGIGRAAARERAMAYGWEAVVTHYLDLYESVLRA